MILADTSILIQLGRKPTVPAVHTLLSRQPAVCGITVAEMYTGVRSEVERQDVQRSLQRFVQVPVEEPVWELTGRILGAMARRGTKVKFQDAVIAATAMHHDLPLWCRDKHFTWIQAAFPKLVLFDENNA